MVPFWIFSPSTESLELVRAITGGDLPLEDIIELEQEALAETGNILLNSCLATIANMLQRSLRMSLPEVLRGDAKTFFSLAPPPVAGDVVMFLYINFAIRERDISGYISMIIWICRPISPALTVPCSTNSLPEPQANWRHRQMIEPGNDILAETFDALDSGVAIFDH